MQVQIIYNTETAQGRERVIVRQVTLPDNMRAVPYETLHAAAIEADRASNGTPPLSPSIASLRY